MLCKCGVEFLLNAKLIPLVLNDPMHCTGEQSMRNDFDKLIFWQFVSIINSTWKCKIFLHISYSVLSPIEFDSHIRFSVRCTVLL